MSFLSQYQGKNYANNNHILIPGKNCLSIHEFTGQKTFWEFPGKKKRIHFLFLLQFTDPDTFQRLLHFQAVGSCHISIQSFTLKHIAYLHVFLMIKHSVLQNTGRFNFQYSIYHNLVFAVGGKSSLCG